MSLYLEYRPTSFDELIGQHHVTDVISAQIEKETFSHTYLLYGPRGTGKTTTARLLAKAVNGLSGEEAENMIDKGQAIDYVEIDAASHTGVENIREEIIDKALYPPSQLKKKVYVIDEVHMLSKGAFNALLKIMEEPPDYLMFILATTEIHKVPDTIISRSQVFNFRRITVDDIVGRLKTIADAEEIDYEEEGLELIAKMANGGVRDAIKYLEQIGMLGKVTVKTVSTFLGVVSEQVITDLLTTIQQGDFPAVVEQLDELEQQGADMAQLAKDIIRYIDEHFMDDPGRYADLANTFKEITIGIKSYPHPTIIYKMHLWKVMNQSVTHHEETATASEEDPKKGSASGATSSSSTNETDDTDDGDDDDDDDGEDSEGLADEQNQADKEAQNPATTKEKPGSAHEELMEQLVEKIDKMMIKSILKKSVIVDELKDDTLSMIVINEQYYNTLKKPDIVTYVEEKLSELRETTTKLKLRYMTKEQYLQEQLGS